MLALIIVLVVLVMLLAAVALVLLGRSKTHAAQAAEPTRTDPLAAQGPGVASGDPRAIGIGDIVEIRGHSWAVRGQLRFREGSWQWREHLLEDSDGSQQWLSVEEDPDLVLALWTPVPGATVTPGPAAVELDGHRYAAEDDGTAKFEAEGTTGLDAGGTVKYHDYTGTGGALLSFEDYGGTGRWEVSRGQQLPRHELRVFPAL
ncbi:MAG: DUF4178 domain-containing protein [Sciscionella sp.]